MKRFLILLVTFVALCGNFAFPQSADEIQQAVREAAELYRGDFLPGQIAIIRSMSWVGFDDGPMICIYGCDPFPSLRFTLSRRAADFEAVPLSLQGPTSNQAMQLTPSRSEPTFHDD